MGGSALQLIAEATENNYLTGNPQITFFKSVYRRHTNFAIESRKLNFTSKPDFGEQLNCRIPKGPDLLHKLYLYVEIPEVKTGFKNGEAYLAFRWLNWLGHAIIKNSKITIGSTLIDEQDGEWLHIWNELSQKEGKKHAYAEMVGNTPDLTQINSCRIGYQQQNNGETLTGAKKLYIPLQFWFCKNAGQALPLIALDKAEVVVDIELEPLEELIWASQQTVNQVEPEVEFAELLLIHSANNTEPVVGDGDGNRTNTIRKLTGVGIFEGKAPSLTNAFIYADYIYLDTDEKKRFVNNRHEYLIEKIQSRGASFTSLNTESHKIDLNFTGPVKEIIWRIRPTTLMNKSFCQSRGGIQRYNYTDKFDFGAFTGVPTPKGGTGMIGGRTGENFFSRLPAVKLEQFFTTTVAGLELQDAVDGIDYSSKFKPNFLSNELALDTVAWDTDRSVSTDNTIAGRDRIATAGYDFISTYFETAERNVVPTPEVVNVSTELTMKHVFNDEAGGGRTAEQAGLGQQFFSKDYSPKRTGIWNTPGNLNSQRILYNGDNPNKTSSLFLNGVRRFDEREGFYFNVIQPYQHHTNVPCSGINVYSFAIDPEDHQPSGTCNFSNISDAEIVITLTEEAQKVVSEVKVYAVSYNILRIEQNTASIAYNR